MKIVLNTEESEKYLGSYEFWMGALSTMARTLGVKIAVIESGKLACNICPEGCAWGTHEGEEVPL